MLPAFLSYKLSLDMLLAQINRDTQSMAEFQGVGDGQHVTLCLTEAVAVTDGDRLENMDGVSLQAVTLADGTTAYIQHNPKGVDFHDGKLVDGQMIQLEDGSTAYVQQVSVPKSGDCLRFEDGQAVQLEDGSTAFIHHTPKDGYDPNAVQAVQLEDGTTAYIHHTIQVPQSDTILTVQADSTLTGLHTGETTVDPETISALEQYATKVTADGSESVSSTGLVNESDHEKKMQIVLQGHVTARVSAKAQQLGEKAFRCEYEGCGRLYTTAHHLKVHERAHTGDRPYRCEHPSCGKAFATGYGLKSHTRTHTGEKPYRCPEESCDKAFKTSGDLQKHIRTHTGERPFKCPFEGCGRSFTTSNIRKVHIRTHTGERPYFCPEAGCGRAFASATNYKNHMRIHTGEKPYVCTVPGCDKRFTEYSSLYKHHVVHTHSKPYNCNHCGKTYKQTSTLAMHKRTAHGDSEPTEEEETFFEPHDVTSGDEILKGQPITYVTGVEEDNGLSGQVTTVAQADVGQHMALIAQDGTQQQVNISQTELQGIGNTITMVTQDGTTITVPTHDAVISTQDTHSVTMVTTDGSDGQQVAIVTPDCVMRGETTIAALQAASVEVEKMVTHQNHEHHLVTGGARPVTLLATANGTQIAVQLGEQQSLEEAIRIASRIQHGETPGIDEHQ
ncbi:zinc finger protein 143 isoform X3 [Carcharodon carcharias]|uniref:zinc finger protein 143 isoform X3 n=1 Tax=Carcharodon carcharias TaxID=13397 RepID=UPI001B7F6D10|nr:zinc finger protein 143 isoform X3 [Carcharodon carcharias]XP_041052753.1 zinc finger protein 143 isoform X3 [Carcharodon carcharias]